MYSQAFLMKIIQTNSLLIYRQTYWKKTARWTTRGLRVHSWKFELNLFSGLGEVFTSLDNEQKLKELQRTSAPWCSNKDFKNWNPRYYLKKKSYLNLCPILKQHDLYMIICMNLIFSTTASWVEFFLDDSPLVSKCCGKKLAEQICR